MSRTRGAKCISPAEAAEAFDLRDAGASTQAIAAALNRDPRAISRLLRDGPEGFAQRHVRRRSRRPRGPYNVGDRNRDLAKVCRRNHTANGNNSGVESNSIESLDIRPRESALSASTSRPSGFGQMIEIFRKLIGKSPLASGVERREPVLDPSDTAGNRAGRFAPLPAKAVVAAGVDKRAAPVDPKLAKLKPLEHARLLLADLHDDHPRGGEFTVAEICERYAEVCLARQLQPVRWMAVARQLRLLVNSRKYYQMRNGQKCCVHAIPPLATRASTRPSPQSIPSVPSAVAGTGEGLAA